MHLQCTGTCTSAVCKLKIICKLKITNRWDSAAVSCSGFNNRSMRKIFYSTTHIVRQVISGKCSAAIQWHQRLRVMTEIYICGVPKPGVQSRYGVWQLCGDQNVGPHNVNHSILGLKLGLKLGLGLGLLSRKCKSTLISHNIKTNDSWNEWHSPSCYSAIFCL